MRYNKNNCGLTKKLRIYGLWLVELRTCVCRIFLILLLRTLRKLRIYGLWLVRLRTCVCRIVLILVRNSITFIQILKLLSNFVKYFCF